jgi:hypothetical protein
MTSHHASLFANCSIGMLFSWRRKGRFQPRMKLQDAFSHG